ARPPTVSSRMHNLQAAAHRDSSEREPRRAFQIPSAPPSQDPLARSRSETAFEAPQNRKPAALTTILCLRPSMHPPIPRLPACLLACFVRRRLCKDAAIRQAANAHFHSSASHSLSPRGRHHI
ncbi:hypothetical protein JI435_069290, partial [Parastagonospora nodorum SN15]